MSQMEIAFFVMAVVVGLVSSAFAEPNLFTGTKK